MRRRRSRARPPGTGRPSRCWWDVATLLQETVSGDAALTVLGLAATPMDVTGGLSVPVSVVVVHRVHLDVVGGVGAGRPGPPVVGVAAVSDGPLVGTDGRRGERRRRVRAGTVHRLSGREDGPVGAGHVVGPVELPGHVASGAVRAAGRREGRAVGDLAAGGDVRGVADEVRPTLVDRHGTGGITAGSPRRRRVAGIAVVLRDPAVRSGHVGDEGAPLVVAVPVHRGVRGEERGTGARHVTRAVHLERDRPGGVDALDRGGVEDLRAGGVPARRRLVGEKRIRRRPPRLGVRNLRMR